MGPGDSEFAEFDQGGAVFVVRQRIQAGDGAGGVVAGEVGGIVQGAGSLDGGTDALQVLAAALLDGLAYQRGLLLGAVAHGDDQR